jgi:lipid-A-disaccharide synthase
VTRPPRLLIVAGEASGDRMAALVARALAARGVRAWGIAGPSCRSAGVDTIADTSSLAAMGIRDALARAPAVLAAIARLARRIRKDPPAAALLVNYTELNTHLGRALRRLGVRVLWCVAPQAWAWREGRFRTLGASLDKLAVILPFEEPLWRRAGVDARYVGHPALDIPWLPRAEARSRLGLLPGAADRASGAGAADRASGAGDADRASGAGDADRASGAGVPALALLPGSRSGEVTRLTRPFCDAASLLLREGSVAAVRLFAAPWLDARARALVHREASRASIPLVTPDTEHGAAPLLTAFDASLCASGTASLEAALAGALPVVAYRMDALSFTAARLLVKTPHIALPNILLGRRAVPELLQDDVTPEALASALRRALGPCDREHKRGALSGADAGIGAETEAGARIAAELRAVLLPSSLAESGARSFGERVADLAFEASAKPGRKALL